MVNLFLNDKKIKELADICILGLGPLGMERRGMEESASLKVREYLSMGLPVYSGDRDIFPPKFPFYRCGNVEIASILNFSKEIENYCPNEVMTLSAEYIDKSKIVARTYSWLMDKHRFPEKDQKYRV